MKINDNTGMLLQETYFYFLVSACAGMFSASVHSFFTLVPFFFKQT